MVLLILFEGDYVVSDYLEASEGYLDTLTKFRRSSKKSCAGHTNQYKVM